MKIETIEQSKVRDFVDVWELLASQIGRIHEKNEEGIRETVKNLTVDNKEESLERLDQLISINHDPFMEVDTAVRCVLAKLYLDRNLEGEFETEVGKAFKTFIGIFDKNLEKKIEAVPIEEKIDPLDTIIKKWKENLTFDFSTLTGEKYSEQNMRKTLLEVLGDSKPVIREIVDAVDLSIQDIDTEVMEMIEEEIILLLKEKAEETLPKGATIRNISIT